MAKLALVMECEHCHEKLSSRTILSHLKKCVKSQVGPLAADATLVKQESYFWLKVAGLYEKQYCLYLQIKQSARLADLDRYLRDLWLECCGHLSQFILNGERYVSMSGVLDEGEKDMSARLKSVLSVGLNMIHEYDFGSTTTLKITVIDDPNGPPQKGKVKLLARNVAPVYTCANCDRTATSICTNCLGETGIATFLCDDCIEDHECDEDMLLPIVNSPRMGVCGYIG